MEYKDETGEEDTPKSGIVEKKVDGKNKKFIKGERLKYYPTGMPLYSSSRGSGIWIRWRRICNNIWKMPIKSNKT